jgi:hypothetical protein
MAGKQEQARANAPGLSTKVGKIGTVTPAIPAVSLKLSIAGSELASRMRDRLRAPSTLQRVVWQKEDGQRLLIYTDSLQTKIVDAWLVVNVTAMTDQTSRQQLQFVFCVGKPGEADGAQAACTVNAPTAGATQIASVWGADLQRVLWDAVLDGLEACVAQAATLKPNQRLTLQGYHCTADMFHAEVVAGDL